MSASVVLGVSAGIAAYKAAHVLRLLVKAGMDVHVVPTPASLSFVGAATWSALSGNPVHTGVFDSGLADHVELARTADLVLVVPATADLVARVRAGMADDLLTTTILAASCPVVLAPAMHTQMWASPATRDNITTLRARGIHVIDPVSGDLSSGDAGVGRLPEPEDIVAQALQVLDSVPGGTPAQAQDMRGLRVLVTAGGTREPLDPVRFIGNISSGRQGCAIARAARGRGAQVTLIASNVDGDLLPAGVEVVDAPTAASVDEAVRTRQGATDLLVMSAAVADFRPAVVSPDKIKKDPNSQGAPVIALERTSDVLARVCADEVRPRVVVGFAAETGDLDEVLRLGRDKALRKGADLLVVNRVGGGHGFGDVPNHVHVLDRQGNVQVEASGTKDDVAEVVLREALEVLGTMTR
ncbi:bifunctional phosphopantothenoylcysteine decarboxylase/phosphopantothenate--cysteine ligase CoaBC [Schaalia sp. 19OD2882]|uniref:bifunctional phosphopantothenoylcysteine decarboxylase/phosphopantothenate--cysteine ligase CoaBC n=1 Tax=Schaalia sp. 19OD2882 TaxID=2794089 RepID=UPI001C1F031F|nr:bifunctional phosphopantothenoylcysteine decarboxylase/phosphopantothenate--cysteine ligase CoaBC [Schaalia sp. 19OD2882]QWW18697.1 bifunctional phosphopantothenoylcysteine decarboxylase/phosphopantothenate--cysteine ligase CoaBC [Schaalia sp. 19OD2882]